MRELLEKAHQEDEKDELFAEEADDDEFEAPRECLRFIDRLKGYQGCVPG